MGKYRSFEDARKFVHKLDLKNLKEWRQYIKSGKIPDHSSVVCTLTGHGLKDPDTAISQCDTGAMININPTLDEVKKAILDNM